MSNLNRYTFLSSNTPGALLTHIKLKEDNYDQWSLSFLGSLRAKRKNCFTNNTMPIEDCGSPKHANWVTMNTLILSWIFTTFDLSLLPYVTYKDNAKE